MSFEDKFPETDRKYPTALRDAFKEIWDAAQEEYRKEVREAILINISHELEPRGSDYAMHKEKDGKFVHDNSCDLCCLLKELKLDGE